jgi:two-component system response regulator VicR
VWGYDYDEGNYSQIKTTVMRLRRKLSDDANNPKYIVNKRGLGICSGMSGR